MLKIYGRSNSINVRKVLWMAEELGLAYQREDWGRGYRSTSEEEFKRINPFEAIPVIDDDGFILRESNVIVRYLAVKHGRDDLFPADLRQRFLCETWMDWVSQDMYAANARPVTMGKAFGIAEFQNAEMLENAERGWTRQMGMLNAHLDDGNLYVLGDTFTVADIPAGLVVNRWYGIDFPKQEFPAVRSYYDRLSERAAYMAHGRNGTP